MVGELSDSGFQDFGSSWWTTTTAFGNGMTANGFNGHLGTSNYLFADGHVKSLKPTATMTPVNMYGAFGSGCCSAIGYTVNDNAPYAVGLQSLQAVQAKWG